MAKVGLAALADGYGLERGEADDCKQSGERFFELLGDTLAPLVARRVKPIAGVGLALESFVEFCTATPTQHTVVLSWPEQAAIAFRIDYQLVRALIDGVLVRDEAPEREAAGGTSTAPAPLTPTEGRIVGNLLKQSLCTVAARVFADRFGTSGTLPAVRAYHTGGPVAETFEPSEMMVVVTGQYSVNGRGGAIAVGAALAASAARRVRPAAPPTTPDPVNGAERARAMLGGASLPLAAVLGSVELPLDAVEALTCGSIIPLRRLRGRVPIVELRSGEQILWAGTVIAERGWYRFLIRRGGEASERANIDS